MQTCPGRLVRAIDFLVVTRDDKDGRAGWARCPIKLPHGARIERIDRDLADRLVDATSLKGENWAPRRQFYAVHAYVREAWKEGEGTAPLDSWDYVPRVWPVVQLSRLIRDNGTSTEHAAQLQLHADGSERIVPFDVFESHVLYRLYPDRPGWLDTDEAVQLRVLVDGFWSGPELPRRVGRARHWEIRRQKDRFVGASPGTVAGDHRERHPCPRRHDRRTPPAPPLAQRSGYVDLARMGVNLLAAEAAAEAARAYRPRRGGRRQGRRCPGSPSAAAATRALPPPRLRRCSRAAARSGSSPRLDWAAVEIEVGVHVEAEDRAFRQHTGAYSDLMFGLCSPLGIEYRPELADMPNQRAWRADRHADYGPLNTLARGRLDLPKIRRHWPDTLRVIASIYTGTVRAYDVTRMLQRDGNPTPLGEAIQHYGGIHKSLHILHLIDDESYRREVKWIRNLQEGRHALARKVFHGSKGELYQRYREGMEDQLGALDLVLNCIVLWNTVYINAALQQLRASGYPVLDEDIVRLHPFMRRHLAVQGDYSFLLPALDGRLRELRDPTERQDEDEDKDEDEEYQEH